MHQEAENLWTVDHLLRLPGGVPFPTRMTVIRVRDGSLVLLSPIPIDDALAAQLAAEGPVGHIIAPNRFHHLALPGACARYPEARLLGVDGVSQKQPGLKFEPLAQSQIASLGDSVEAVAIEGAPRLSETVFFHRPSRTLIVTDLVFNVERAPSWASAVMFWMTGTHGRLAQSRAWTLVINDAKAARKSSERIFEWDFDRLIVAHGTNISSGAKPRLAAAVTRTGSPATKVVAPIL
jgi:hypothetical protein